MKRANCVASNIWRPFSVRGCREEEDDAASVWACAATGKMFVAANALTAMPAKVRKLSSKIFPPKSDCSGMAAAMGDWLQSIPAFDKLRP